MNEVLYNPLKFVDIFSRPAVFAGWMPKPDLSLPVVKKSFI